MLYYAIKPSPMVHSVRVCQTHHFVCEGMAKVGAVGGEQQWQAVDQLWLGEAEDNWKREKEPRQHNIKKPASTSVLQLCTNLMPSGASPNCGRREQCVMSGYTTAAE